MATKYLYKTASGSIYEVRPANKEIRRVFGINEPTERQGADGEWKKYEDLSTDFDHLVIIWGDVDGIYKTTVTSKITDYDEVDDGDPN